MVQRVAESDTDYHLGELAIAKDPSDHRHIVPEVSPSECVLDIGCGAGQSLIVVAPGRPSYGVDLDLAAITLGKKLTQDARFACAVGEMLPFRDGSFDLVFSRVAMPYMRIGIALSEAKRVLRSGGRVWFTLHDFSTAAHRLSSARSLRAAVYALYVLGNGLLFNLFGRQLAFRRRCETFQTAGGFCRALRRVGFTNIEVQKGRHFLITARLP